MISHSDLFENPENKIILILDPMLATGNSAIDAIKLFVNKNVPEKNIRFVSLISAPEGLDKVTALYPDVQIVTANIDECLNEMGYIRPGLGDAGDRIFNTVEN
jgi:uracil phosphoribosyltransferase